MYLPWQLLPRQRAISLQSEPSGPPRYPNMFKAEITVTLRPSILDPQGKAAHHALGELGFNGVHQVRIGKFIELEIEAASAQEAEKLAREAADKLLANPVMEDFQVTVHELTSA